MEGKFIFLSIFIYFLLFEKSNELENILNGRCLFVIDYSKVIDFHLIKIDNG